jgi:D-sedoheptulose 7-phosphate isomerase
MPLVRYNRGKGVRTMLEVHLGVDDYFARLKTELDRVQRADVERLAGLVYRAWQDGRFVFVFGNGGSAATASHFAADWGKNCVCPEDLAKVAGRRLKVLSLTDNVPWFSALGNDLGYDHVFVQQLVHYASPGDLAIAISGSGNSPNVLKAVQWANEHGIETFGLTGYDGGKLKQIQQAGIHVALHDMAMVESIHACIGHWIVDDLTARISRTGRYWPGADKTP